MIKTARYRDEVTMKILIVEDEFALADVIRDRLVQDDYEADIAHDGYDGETLALTNVYDLIILDGMLPGIDGYDILQHARKKGIICPIIMLTARAELADKIRGLNCGADDYMTKPFEIEELLARVNAMLRRQSGFIGELPSYGDIILDKRIGSLTCTGTGRSIKISSKELLLMEYLLINRQTIVTREQISDRIWGFEDDLEYNNVEVYISFLRKKLKYLGAGTSIMTQRGIGYYLEK